MSVGRITIREIAKSANVSPSTVSNVINNNERHVSPKTAERVRRLIEESGFTPDTVGRSLRRRSTDSIGVIILNVSAGQIAEPWIAVLLSGISSVMSACGKTIVVDLWQTGADDRQRYQRIFHGNLFDGAILIGPKRNEWILSELVREGYPFVAMEWSAPGYSVNSVCANDFNGAYMAVTHLIERGHRRIGMINGDTGFFSAVERLNGYNRALADHGLAAPPELEVVGEFSESDGFKHAVALMAKSDPPTAIFAGDDLLAIGAINGLRHAGLEIPRDVSVVGFDDIPMARYLTPPLTTVRLPMWDMGVAAAEQLQRILAPGKRQARQIIFDVELLVRGSTAQAPAGKA